MASSKRDAEGRVESLRRAEQVAALPGQRLAERQKQRAAARSAAANVMLKNGAPTEIFSPVIASSASG